MSEDAAFMYNPRYTTLLHLMYRVSYIMTLPIIPVMKILINVRLEANIVINFPFNVATDWRES